MAMYDARKNMVKEGDTVSLEIASKTVVGEIREIEEGGLIAGISRRDRKLETALGFVTVLVAFKIAVNPEQPMIPNMLKLHAEPALNDGKTLIMQ
jgi:hypothetical protein